MEETEMTYVRTKEELQAAVDRKDAEIIVVGELAKKIEPIVKLKSLSKTKIAAILVLVPGLIAASILVPGGGAVSAGVITKFAAAKGITALTGQEILILATIIAVTGLAIIALMRDYNVKIKANSKGELEVIFTKKCENVANV